MTLPTGVNCVSAYPPNPTATRAAARAETMHNLMALDLGIISTYITVFLGFLTYLTYVYTVTDRLV